MKEYEAEVPVTMDVFKTQLQLVAEIFRRLTENEQLKAVEFAKEFMKELLQEMQLVLDKIYQKEKPTAESKACSTEEAARLQDSELRQWNNTSVPKKVNALTDDSETQITNNNSQQQSTCDQGSNFVYRQLQNESCATTDYTYLLCEKIQSVQDPIEHCLNTVEKCRNSKTPAACKQLEINNSRMLPVEPVHSEAGTDPHAADNGVESKSFRNTLNDEVYVNSHCVDCCFEMEVPTPFSSATMVTSRTPTLCHAKCQDKESASTNVEDVTVQEGSVALMRPGDNVQIKKIHSINNCELQGKIQGIGLQSDPGQASNCIAVTSSQQNFADIKGPLLGLPDTLTKENAGDKYPATGALRTTRYLCKKKGVVQKNNSRNRNSESHQLIKKQKLDKTPQLQNEAENSCSEKKIVGHLTVERSTILTRASARALTKTEVDGKVNADQSEDNTKPKRGRPLKKQEGQPVSLSRQDHRHYDCSECGQSFSHGKSYKAHIIRHGVQELSCRRCRKRFVNTIEFQSHTCKANLVLYCSQCHVSFNHPQHFQKHMSGHNRNNCKFCNAQFAKRKALCRHLRTVHKIVEAEKFYYCPHCNRKFIKRPSLYVHLKDHADGKIVCMKCGCMCDTEENFTKHTLKHTAEAKFHCEKCNENFIRRQQYEQHMTGHDKYDCTLCDISFSTKKHQLKHKRLVHGIQTREEKKHVCVVCDKKFQRPMLLRIHMRIHTGERPIQCTHCDKNFRTPKALAKHMKTSAHLKASGQTDAEPVELDKPFLCAQCGAKFFRRQGLVRHMQQLHTDTCPYTCPYCDYSCKCKTNLKRHIELHTTERRYVCEVCGASFHARATLKEHHAYVHSDSRNFSCSDCGKSFKGRSGLRRHMRIHSDARPYICYCGQAYKRMSHLKRHMISLHGALFKSKRVTRIVGDDSSQTSSSFSALSKTNAERFQENETMTLQVSDGFLVLPDKESCADNNSLTITVQHDVVELLQNISVEQIGTNAGSEVDLSQQQTGTVQEFLPLRTGSDVVISASQEVICQTLNTECPRSAQPLMTSSHQFALQQLVSESSLPCEIESTSDSNVPLPQVDGNTLSSLQNDLFSSNVECSARGTQRVQIFSSTEIAECSVIQEEQVQNAYSQLTTSESVQNNTFCISHPCSSSSSTHSEFSVSSSSSAALFSVTRHGTANESTFSDSDSSCQQIYPITKSEYSSNVPGQDSSAQSQLPISITSSYTPSSTQPLFSPSSPQKVFTSVMPSHSI